MFSFNESYCCLFEFPHEMNRPIQVGYLEFICVEDRRENYEVSDELFKVRWPKNTEIQTSRKMKRMQEKNMIEWEVSPGKIMAIGDFGQMTEAAVSMKKNGCIFARKEDRKNLKRKCLSDDSSEGENTGIENLPILKKKTHFRKKVAGGLKKKSDMPTGALKTAQVPSSADNNLLNRIIDAKYNLQSTAGLHQDVSRQPDHIKTSADSRTTSRRQPTAGLHQDVSRQPDHIRTSADSRTTSRHQPTAGPHQDVSRQPDHIKTSADSQTTSRHQPAARPHQDVSRQPDYIKTSADGRTTSRRQPTAGLPQDVSRQPDFIKTTSPPRIPGVQLQQKPQTRPKNQAISSTNLDCSDQDSSLLVDEYDESEDDDSRCSNFTLKYKLDMYRAKVKVNKEEIRRLRKENEYLHSLVTASNNMPKFTSQVIDLMRKVDDFTTAQKRTRITPIIAPKPKPRIVDPIPAASPTAATGKPLAPHLVPKTPAVQDKPTNSSELVPLGTAGLTISARKLQRCNAKSFSKLTTDLMQILFTPSEMATSSMTGAKSNRSATACTKAVINPHIIGGITDYVLQKFECCTTEEIKKVMKIKLNNEAKRYVKSTTPAHKDSSIELHITPSHETSSCLPEFPATPVAPIPLPRNSSKNLFGHPQLNNDSSGSVPLENEVAGK